MAERKEVLALVEGYYDDPTSVISRPAAVDIYGMAADLVLNTRMPCDPLRTDEPWPAPVASWAETYLL
jgi:hypothetical protein